MIPIPDTTTLAVFAAASLALYVAPGPDMLYIASRSIGHGRRAGVVSALGVFAGLVIHMLGAAFGLSALLVVWPLAYTAVKWVGVAYLLYLGVRVLLDKNHGLAPSPVKGGTLGHWQMFRRGLFVNLLNPKIALFFLAFLPQFADESLGGFAAQMLFLGALFNLGGLVWILFLAIAFGAVGDWFRRNSAVWRWQRWFTGSVLVALALHLAVTERK